MTADRRTSDDARAAGGAGCGLAPVLLSALLCLDDDYRRPPPSAFAHGGGCVVC